MNGLRIAGIVLAAGRSTRMGERNKLTTNWNGKPLVRHVIDATLASKLEEVIVVTGHETDAVFSVLPKAQKGRMSVVENSVFSDGMGTSIRRGIEAVQALKKPVDGALILLGDMPLVSATHIDLLLNSFRVPSDIVMATCNGKAGNPVLFGNRYFADLGRLQGDRGARNIIVGHEISIIKVEIGEAAARDFDVPNAFLE